MLGSFDNVRQWSEQAHKYTEEGAGDQLLDLDEQKSLIPYKEEGSLWQYTPWGRKVARHCEDLKATCIELAREADGLAQQAGLRGRVTEKLEGRDWEGMTIQQLARDLDDLLSTRSVQLLKARKALDDMLACCHGYIHREDESYEGSYVAKTSVAQHFKQFPDTLAEVFHQLNRIGGDPQNNWQLLKNLLQTDVQNALLKICGDVEHPQFENAVVIANDLSSRFDECMGALQFLPKADKAEAPENMNEEQIPERTQHTTAATDLISIKRRIQSIAQAPSDHGTRTNCQQLMEAIHTYFHNLTLPIDSVIQQVAELAGWLTPIVGTVDNQFAQDIIADELLIPLTGLQEELEKQRVAQWSPPPVSSEELIAAFHAKKPVVITEHQLANAGLVSNHEEYLELGKVLPEGFLTYPDIIPCLDAFRNMQAFNPGFNNRDFAELVKLWPHQRLLDWAERLNKNSATVTPYYDSMPEMAAAIKGIGQAQNIPEPVLEVIPLLSMDGLSVPHICEQLHALSLLVTLPQGSSALSLQDMAYIINHDILSPYQLHQINQNQRNPGELSRIRNELLFRSQQHWERNQQALNEFHERGIAGKTHQSYGLVPKAVTANDDDLFHSVAHLVGEPMRKVRRRCQRAAQDILAMSQGRFQGDMSTPYAGRLIKAARYLDMNKLRQDAEQQRLLIPSCERRDPLDAKGTDADLALIAVVYGYSVVPVDIQSGYTDVHGYYADGGRYQYQDSSTPPAVVHMRQRPEEGPLMLINDGIHWRPLVSAQQVS